MNRIQAVPELSGAGAACFFDLEGEQKSGRRGVYAHRGQIGIFTIP